MRHVFQYAFASLKIFQLRKSLPYQVFIGPYPYSAGLRRAILWMLRQAIGNFVVIAFIGNENMLSQFCAGRRIERAHRNSGARLTNRLPEQE